MKASKDTLVHKIAAHYIVGENIKIDIFENDLQNKAFKFLLEQTKLTRKSILKESSKIEEISKELDKKRYLVDKFQSVTGITWRL